jgi:hypothetical protein
MHLETVQAGLAYVPFPYYSAIAACLMQNVHMFLSFITFSLAAGSRLWNVSHFHDFPHTLGFGKKPTLPSPELF